MDSTATFDIIVVGARIVGASTAGLLAQQGFTVLLLEKSTFPSPTVSCPVIFGNALAVLDRFGAESVVDALGAPRLRLYGTDYGFARLEAHLPAYRGRDYAYSIQRHRLDEAVAHHVATLPGVTLREGFAVSDLIRENGRVVGVRGTQHGGANEELRARFAVIGADGRNSFVARQVGAAEYNTKPAQAWLYYAYYHNVTPLHEPSAMVYRGTPRQNVLVFDADQNLTVLSIGAVDPPFEVMRKDPERVMLAAIRRVPELARRVEHAERATPIMGLAPTGMFYRQPFGAGWALVGDAGMRIDPVTGQGIYQGLHTAEMLVDALVHVRNGVDWNEAMSMFQRRRDRECKASYEYAALQAEPKRPDWLSRRFIRHMENEPKLRSYYFGTVNGATPPEENFNLRRILPIALRPLPRKPRSTSAQLSS